MNVWVDDLRDAPEGYTHVKSVDRAIELIANCLREGVEIAVLDLDHDAGDFYSDGGDYIRILDWLECAGISVPIRIHTMNPVGRQNMLNIIERNGWKLI